MAIVAFLQFGVGELYRRSNDELIQEVLLELVE